MRCDIVLPIWNKKELTRDCIESIIKNTSYPYRVILIDNASRSETKEYLEGLKQDNRLDVLLIRNEENVGYTAAVNQGIDTSDADFICIQNNDTIVTRGWLGEMVKIAGLKEEIGIVNPESNTLGRCPPDESVGGIEKYAEQFLKCKGQYTELGAAVGFSFLMKRSVIDKIGGWDEVFSPGYFDDTDYALRAAKAGYKSVCAKAAYVYHVEHASFRDKKLEEIFKRNEQIFYERHGKPKRILYVIDKQNKDYYDIVIKKSYDSAKNADWVWIFIKRSMPALSMPEHGNIRLFVFSPGLFILKAVYRILMRQKKKFDFIYVVNPGLEKILKILKFIHKAEIKMLS